MRRHKLLGYLACILILSQLYACNRGGGSSGSESAATSPSLTSVEIMLASKTLDVNEVVQLGAMANYSDGSQQDITTSAQWSVSDPMVVQLDITPAIPTLSALQIGQSSISCQFESSTVEENLEVRTPILSSLDLQVDRDSLILGESANAQVFGMWSDGSMQNLTLVANLQLSQPQKLNVTTADPIELSALSPGQVEIIASHLGVSSNSHNLDLMVSPIPLAGHPYAQSPAFAGLQIDFASLRSFAPGSDNWCTTWGMDGEIYSSWGDGGGFGGDNLLGRVSLGVAKITGSGSMISGENIYGGFNGNFPASIDGKSYGILDIDSELYMWVGPGTNSENYQPARLYHSDDQAATWQAATWELDSQPRIILPTFLQFGSGYSGSRDDYVYCYAPRLSNDMNLAVQQAGQVHLFRTSKNEILSQNSYEYFAGLDAQQEPIWTADSMLAEAVFEDARGVGWNLSACYHAPTGRYLLMTEHDTSFTSSWGVFDAPEPWGPWTVVHYEEGFGSAAWEQSLFYWNMPTKLFNGLSFELFTTGIGDNDTLHILSGSFNPYP